MRQLQVLTLAGATAIALLLGGCAGAVTSSAPQNGVSGASSAPLQSPAPNSTNPHPILGGGEKTTPASTAPNQGDAEPSTIKLVPMPDQEDVQEKMLIPEGAQVTTTALGDGIQVFKGKAWIHVHTWQLRDQKVPMTVDAVLTEARKSTPDVTVKQIQLPRTVVAYELEYSQVQSGVTVRGIAYHLYGTTYQTTVECEVPAAEFATWEPVFRQILASFQPGNLDAEPLPARP